MGKTRGHRFEHAGWKKVLDRLAVAWIVCAPLLALAAGWPGDELRQGPPRTLARADRMALPATDGVVRTPHGKEERVESFQLDPARGGCRDCDR